MTLSRAASCEPCRMAVTLPSGISSVLMSLQTVPWLQRSASVGSSTEISAWGMATSQPVPDSTSDTSLMLFSRPTVTGKTVPGKMTALRRGSTGRAGGSWEVSTFMDAASPTTGIMLTSTPAGVFILSKKSIISAKMSYFGAQFARSLIWSIFVPKKDADRKKIFGPNILKSQKLSLILPSFSARVKTKFLNYKNYD